MYSATDAGDSEEGTPMLTDVDIDLHVLSDRRDARNVEY